ncbi:MAG: class I SAM-dependent RNA methyltransferase [Lewinella sp.]|nr:class I SAM-dependent RNA methyltransferase [Lewinella sp.]
MRLFMELLVKTMMGLEDVLAAELSALGAVDVSLGHRVVSCQGDLRLLYRANLELRTALRVLVVIATFQSNNERSLYRSLQRTNWSRYLAKDGTLWVDAMSQSERFPNSQYLARLTKDAVVDQFREQTGVRPNVVKDESDLRINLHVAEDGFTTLSLDSSGAGLHRRGYRRQTGEAPLNEVLAAGLLLLAGYRGEQPFVDPMCGSGTIVCEAAMIAARRAPGMGRRFGFQQWPDFDPELLGEIRQLAFEQQRTPPYPIVGADADLLAVPLARVALDRLTLTPFVSLVTADFAALVPPPPTDATVPGGLLLMNPPYELRLKTGDIEHFYQQIGDVLKQQYQRYSAWIFSANREALKRVGLRTSRKIPLMNGPLEARLQRYDMYAGTAGDSSSN